MHQACAFAAGALPADTLGLDRATVARLPIDHLIVVMQENRSFDHYFASLSTSHPDVEPLPPGYANPDASGASIAPFHLSSPCLPADPPHQWDGMHAGWNLGAMDGFVRNAAVGGSDGHYAVGTYDESDLPFYYWLARTFALADRRFASALGGTWPNRAILYTGSTYGLRNTGDFTIPAAETIFDPLDAAGVAWGGHTDGTPRQDLLGWSVGHAGVHPEAAFLAALAAGTLEPVTFVDPTGADDEHPPRASTEARRGPGASCGRPSPRRSGCASGSCSPTTSPVGSSTTSRRRPPARPARTSRASTSTGCGSP